MNMGSTVKYRYCIDIETKRQRRQAAQRRKHAEAAVLPLPTSSVASGQLPFQPLLQLPGYSREFHAGFYRPGDMQI